MRLFAYYFFFLRLHSPNIRDRKIMIEHSTSNSETVKAFAPLYIFAKMLLGFLSPDAAVLVYLYTAIVPDYLTGTISHKEQKILNCQIFLPLQDSSSQRLSARSTHEISHKKLFATLVSIVSFYFRNIKTLCVQMR